METVNGAQVQSFRYDLHDKLTGGIGESETYDPNGNLHTVTLNGQTTTYTWDDEDRLTGIVFPDNHSDTFTYTGLGMRLRKNDPTGNYWYLCDGVSAASPVLSDGYTSFTPGISEISGAGSRFYLPDVQGNSRGLLDSNQVNTDGYNWDAFGNLISRGGTNPTAFAWGGGSGYQSDGDSGLKLLGHRYYDSRTGRFISQDPAGDGDNWYAYCGNDPVDGTDPQGLVCALFNSTGMSDQQIYDHVTANGGLPGEVYDTTDSKGNVLHEFEVQGFTFNNIPVVAPHGFNMGQDIMAARNFYHSLGPKPDPSKIGAYLYDHYHPGNKHGDPKIYGKQYDKYGHAIYAAAASELKVTLDTIVQAQVDVHRVVHLTTEDENSSGDTLGWSYDQHYFHPGKGIYNANDVFSGGIEEYLKSKF